MNGSSPDRELTWHDFLEYADEGCIEKIVDGGDGTEAKIYFSTSSSDSSSCSGASGSPDQNSNFLWGSDADATMMIPPGEEYLKQLHDLEAVGKLTRTYEPVSEWGGQILSWVIFLGLMVVVWMFLMRRLGGGQAGGGQIFNIGKSKARVFEKGEGTDVTFTNVAGVDGAKEELQEIVDFLKLSLIHI